MTTREIVERCERLYMDMDFEAVREWKERTGGMAIGFMPIYVPREVIRAAGALPVGIMGGGDNIEIIRGDAYYQSYICHIPRSTIELGLSGRLDVLDGMLFPAICDVIRNLSGMWQLMFEGKFVRYVDLPQNFAPDRGGAFYRAELQRLADDLGRRTGVEVTREALNDAIERYNENARAVRELYALRADEPHRVPSAELYLVLRAGNVLDVDEHTKLVRDYIEAARTEDRPERDNIRVIVTGVFCEQPSLGLIRALEQSGCYIVDDDWVLVNRYIDGDIAVGDDPIGAIVEAYLERGVATSSRYIGDDEKGRHLVERVRAMRADGVIFASPSFCDPALLERPMLEAALDREGIPHSAFKYAENSGQFHAIKEQTGTFADSIKLWGVA